MNLLSGRQQIETGSWMWLGKWHQQCSKSALFPQQVLRHLFLQEEEVVKCQRYCFLAPSDVCNNIPSHPAGHLLFLSGSSFLSFISLRKLRSRSRASRRAPGERQAGGLGRCRVRLCRGGLQHLCLSANLWTCPRAGWGGQDRSTRPLHWAQSISNSLWINKYRI